MVPISQRTVFTHRSNAKSQEQCVLIVRTSCVVWMWFIPEGHVLEAWLHCDVGQEVEFGRYDV